MGSARWRRRDFGVREGPEFTRYSIHARKSTTERLDSSSNTLDTQNKAAEPFRRNQADQGSKRLPTRYVDGGFTGGKLEHPALT